jgi:hypothetical protein
MGPTVFRAGHQEFQCVMVVGPDYDGKLQWTLNYAGTSTGTSQHQLQSNWNLIEDVEALKRIEYAKVPRGVCLNQPPRVRILGMARGGNAVLNATLKEPLNLFGSVSDEGLPREGGLVVGWKQITGPGTATFSHATAARTRVSFTAPGSYELEITATDSEFVRAARARVDVK